MKKPVTDTNVSGVRFPLQPSLYYQRLAEAWAKNGPRLRFVFPYKALFLGCFGLGAIVGIWIASQALSLFPNDQPGLFLAFLFVAFFSGMAVRHLGFSKGGPDASH